MSIEQAERLRQELTDKYVVVVPGVPELRRFVGLTGTVKTVNMNGKALVQFDGPVDIAWYDIDPAYLDVVEAPLPRKAPAKHAAPAAAPQQKPKPAPAKKAAGMSPLELARQQRAAKAGTPAATPAKAEKPAEEGKKLSPLELARQQGAAKGATPAAARPATEPSAEKPAAAGKKLSPLELARLQGAAKSGAAAGEKSAEVPVTVPPESAGQAESASEQAASAQETPPASATPAGGKKLSPLELARLQGPAKR